MPVAALAALHSGTGSIWWSCQWCFQVPVCRRRDEVHKAPLALAGPPKDHCQWHWQVPLADLRSPYLNATTVTHWHGLRNGSYYGLVLVLLLVVEMFKAHLAMIQRKSASPYARKTASEKGPRPGGAVKAPPYSSQPHLNCDCSTQPRATSIASTSHFGSQVFAVSCRIAASSPLHVASPR